MRSRRPLLRGCVIAGLLAGTAAASELPAAPSPSATESAAPVTPSAPPPAVVDPAARFAERLRDRVAHHPWRLHAYGALASASEDVAGMDLRRRFGAGWGLGLSWAGTSHVYARLDAGRNGYYDHDVLGLQYFTERRLLLIPGVAGMTLTAGPMLTSYWVRRGNEDDDVAEGWGGGAAAGAYLSLPIVQALFDGGFDGWWALAPMVDLEVRWWGGWNGRLHVVGDWDLNGDGVNDLVDGRRFAGPHDDPTRIPLGASVSLGCSWMW